MRGEYLPGCGNIPASWELPPRARRILAPSIVARDRVGTTSACAENTPRVAHERGESGNYLRVRGEYARPCRGSPARVELPPRARRIRCVRGLGGLLGGTTSACAENTTAWTGLGIAGGNYLRVRGEYCARNRRSHRLMELPPRARRIPATPTGGYHGYRTTSACAENTLNELGLL